MVIFHSFLYVYQRVCTVETQLETRVLQCALMGQGCFAYSTWHHNFVRKRLCCFFLLVSGPNRMEREQNIFRCISYTYIYIYIYIIYINSISHYITITTDYPYDVTTDASILSPLYRIPILFLWSHHYSHYIPLSRHVHDIPIISLWYPKYIPMNVGKAIINHPMFDSLYHPLMVNLGMFWDIVLTCFNHINGDDILMISSFPPGKFQLLPLQAQADPASRRTLARKQLVAQAFTT